MPLTARNNTLHRDMTHFEAWTCLPVVLDIKGLSVRWLGPLVDIGHDRWLGSMSQAAWGHLEDCGWADLLPNEGFLRAGKVAPAWVEGLFSAAVSLSLAGVRAGPECDPEIWVSWLCFEISEPHRYLRALEAPVQ
jgi:hypothetical protein